MHNNSTITLSNDALKKNLQFLKRHFNQGVIISSVVKGNAYGHDISQFVKMAYKNGIRHFSVFDSSEARSVFEVVKDKAQIMIMGWMNLEDDMQWVIENDIEFYVFEEQRLKMAVKMARKLKKKAIIHIEVETGMNRTGFNNTQLNRLFKYLKTHSELIILKGLCTHYAGAESVANYYRIQQQIQNYNTIYQQFCEQDLKPEIRHTACSAASMMFPETQMDMVRIGIMQYGFWPSMEVLVHYYNHKRKRKDPLRRVIEWTSQISSIKKIKRGEFIGYGNSFMADENMKIAVVPIGYSNGYNRNLSNVGRVLINGQRCVVVGNINMNMMVIDVSLLKDVAIGDEVILIGKQGDLEISVASFSDYSNMLNYELLSRISSQIPRIIN